jgi:hypothetical protein
MSSTPPRQRTDEALRSLVTSATDRLTLSYRAVLLIFRLLIGILFLLWAPSARMRGELAGSLDTWQAQALLVVLYVLYCTLLFALAGRHHTAQAIGSFIDVAMLTTLIWASGGSDSPLTGLYLALTALTTFHYGLAIGMGHGALSGVLWALCYVGDSTDAPPVVEMAYAAVSPLVVAFLCGMLRSLRAPGILGAERTGIVPGRMDEWLAAHTLAVAGSPTPCDPAARFLAERGVRAWHEAGVKAVAVFGVDTPDAEVFTLRWTYRSPDLSLEVGTLTMPRDCAGSLVSGAQFVDPGSEVGSAATAFFTGWGRGQLAVIAAGPEGRPCMLAIAASARASFAPGEAAILVSAGERIAEAATTT